MMEGADRELELSFFRLRTVVNHGMTAILIAGTVLALLPLVSVLVMLILRGGASVSFRLFTELPPGTGMSGGGIGNAIVGTLVMTGVATALSVPFGILTAVYLAEYGGRSRLASFVRFSAKVMTGMPSILAGVFAYAVVVMVTKRFSALAGGVALAVLMVPIVILTAEEAIRMVPHKMREAAWGMGATDTQTFFRVVMPGAAPGMLTGVMLSIARAMGETAPLLFTALSSYYWFRGNLMQPISSLSVLIYNFATMPYQHQQDLAWAAALVLVGIVLIVNVTGQLFTRRIDQ